MAQPIQASSFNLAPNSVTPGAYLDTCPSPSVSTGAILFPWGYPMPIAKAQLLSGYVIDFSQIVNNQLAKGIQSVFIDNSQCSFPVCLTDAAGDTITLPGGWQGFFRIQFWPGSTVTLTPVGNFNFLKNLIKNNYVTGGTQVQPLQTILNFLNSEIMPSSWKVQDYYSYVDTVNVSNRTLYPYLNGRITTVFSGGINVISGTSNFAVMQDTILNYLGYNSFTIDHIEPYCSMAYGSNPATAINGNLYFGTSDNSSNGPFPQVNCVPTVSILISQLYLQQTSPNIYPAELPFNGQNCSMIIEKISDSGLPSNLYCGYSKFQTPLMNSNSTIQVFATCSGVVT